MPMPWWLRALPEAWRHALIRRRAAEWKIDPDRIGMVGFSAGAMLTMLSDVMIPEAHEHGGNTVGLFTVFGFLLAAMLSVLQ